MSLGTLVNGTLRFYLKKFKNEFLIHYYITRAYFILYIRTLYIIRMLSISNKKLNKLTTLVAASDRFLKVHKQF